MIEIVETRLEIKEKGLDDIRQTELKSSKTILNIMCFLSVNSSLGSD